MRAKCVALTMILMAGCTGIPAHQLRPAPISSRAIETMQPFLNGQTTKNDGGLLSQTFTFFGREDLAEQLIRGRKMCEPLMENNAAVAPIPYIVAHATGTRAVILNEAHDLPRDRAFISDVAEALHAEGYSLYGAETFSPSVGENGPAWPLLGDGYYSKEPSFGKLLRSLRKNGYRFFAYEFQGTPNPEMSAQERINRRDAGEADNVAAHLRLESTNVKVLLHVGYSHAFKHPETNNPGTHWLAERFQAATGIEPLTVDQTRYWSPDKTVVICDPTKLSRPPNSDIIVGTPRPLFERGRPKWRLERGEAFYEIPNRFRREDELAVYEARYTTEPADAVPADRLMLRPGEHLPLLLPHGRFKLSVWTQKSGWSGETEIRVK